MAAFEEFHDTDEKTLPAGQSAQQDLDGALDNIFNHPNVGPLIGKALIQRLVTSNPTPAYVRRVADAFNDNGAGERGDLQAVVRAILLDDEARTGNQANPETFGKLREPLLKLSALWRAFNVEGLPIENNGSLTGKTVIRYFVSNRDFAQRALSSPSVFNFFMPSYQQPGPIKNQDLFSPEFQIVNEATVVTGANRLWRSVANRDRDIPERDVSVGANVGAGKMPLNLSAEKALADNPAALIDRLDQLLMAGQMSDPMRQTLIDHVDAMPLNDDGRGRVEDAIVLVVSSPEFALQR